MNDTKTDGPMTCEEMRARIEDLERRVRTLARERDEAIDARLDAEREAAHQRVLAHEAIYGPAGDPPAEWPAEDPMEDAQDLDHLEERGEVTPVRPALPAGFGAVR